MFIHPAADVEPAKLKKTVQSLANLYKSNNLFKLETKAKKLLKKYPNELNLHNLIGISFAGQKKFNEAIKSFQKIELGVFLTAEIIK